MVGYFGQLARSTATVGFEVLIPQGYHVPHCVGNPLWRIPNSSVRTNSSETKRSSSLSLKKLTELIWDFQWLHSKELGRCRILRWASLGNFSLVLPRPPLTVRCFLWLKKEKKKLQKQKSSRYIILTWISSLHGDTNFFTFKIFKKTKVFS